MTCGRTSGDLRELSAGVRGRVPTCGAVVAQLDTQAASAQHLIRSSSQIGQRRPYRPPRGPGGTLPDGAVAGVAVRSCCTATGQEACPADSFIHREQPHLPARLWHAEPSPDSPRS